MAMVVTNTNKAHNETTLRSLQPGDLIQFDRGGYYHWGLYLGNEEVIHLTGTEEGGIRGNTNPQHSLSVCGRQFDKAKVCTENFWKIVGKDKAFKNNSKDSSYRAFDPDEIISRAKSMVGKVKYNVLEFNCEHFVNWCRYNIKESDQADLLFAGLCLGGAAATGAAIFTWYKRLNKSKKTEG